MNAIINCLTLYPIDLRATSSHFDVSTPTIHMVAGVTAGFFSTTLTHPFDMLKTRMQLKPAEYRNVLQAARKVLMVRPLILNLDNIRSLVNTQILFNWILTASFNVHETITQIGGGCDWILGRDPCQDSAQVDSFCNLVDSLRGSRSVARLSQGRPSRLSFMICLDMILILLLFLSCLCSSSRIPLVLCSLFHTLPRHTFCNIAIFIKPSPNIHISTAPRSFSY